MQNKTLDEDKHVRGGLIIKPKPMQSLPSRDERLESKKRVSDFNKSIAASCFWFRKYFFAPYALLVQFT